MVYVRLCHWCLNASPWAYSMAGMVRAMVLYNCVKTKNDLQAYFINQTNGYINQHWIANALISISMAVWLDCYWSQDMNE